MAEESTTTESSTESVEQPEMVKITDASESDLDAFLEENKYQENENTPEPEQQQEPEQEKVDPSKEQATNTKPTQEQIAEQQKKLREQLDRFQKQLQGQELLIHRQISKIGEYRKQLVNDNRELLAKIEDKQLEDPRGAEIARLKLNQNQQQINKLSEQERTLSKRSNFMQTVTRFVPPNELPPVDDLCKCLKDDGLDENSLAKFREDPSIMPPSTFIQLQRRARAEKAVMQMIPAFMKVVSENKDLKAQLSNGKRNVLSGVEKAARQTPSVANARPSVSHAPDFMDVTKLSDSELDELLRRGQI